MAKKGNNNNDTKFSTLKVQTKNLIIAIVFFVFALLFLLSKFNVAGFAGVFIKDNFKFNI